MNKILSLVINESGFTFDPFTGETYTVNQTGNFVIRNLREGISVDKIAKELIKEYDISYEKVYTDILEFRNQLVIYGLIEAV